MTISRGVLLIMRNVSDKVVNKMKTHILWSVNFFSPKIVPLMRYREKNTVEPGRPQTTI